MTRSQYDLIIIGGGPAGLAAALSARRNGIDGILILERDARLGGVLNQCIHAGFGLHTFKEELTGPEYAERFIREVRKENIECRLNTTVLGIGADRTVSTVSAADGYRVLSAKAVILAMGCRERPRGALNIPGSRPAGIYSAGTAQYLMNIEGKSVGRRIVILGSGDIGLIMARRLTLEGAKVELVAELMPYSGGLKRNIVQCLDDFGIPLLLSTTVTRIHGQRRVEGVTLAAVDEKRRPVPGTERFVPCDTLLLSVGLLPENELTRQLDPEMSPVTGGAAVSDCLELSREGIFACGNVLHVHDLVDYVSEEAAAAGASAAAYIRGTLERGRMMSIRAGKGVRYTVPSRVDIDHAKDAVTVRFRVDNVYRDRGLCVRSGERCILSRKKRILTPGEMEQISITKEQILSADPAEGLTVCVEGEAEKA